MAAEALLSDPLVVMLLLAFAPALFYLVALALRHPGPSARYALLGFGYGATVSIAVLGLLYVALVVVLGDPEPVLRAFFADRHVAGATEQDFILIVVLAPMMEEAAKGLGVWLLGWRLRSGRDGAFLGAAVGLGFAGIETFGYLLAAADGGALVGATLLTVVAVALLRSVTSALLHPAATGITGYGVARARLRGVPVVVGALPYYGLAVALHGTYNYLAAFLPPQAVGGLTLEVNLVAAMLLAALAWGALKRGVARWA